jgi:hypothetical protein
MGCAVGESGGRSFAFTRYLALILRGNGQMLFVLRAKIRLTVKMKNKRTIKTRFTRYELCVPHYNMIHESIVILVSVATQRADTPHRADRPDEEWQHVGSLGACA